MQKKLLFSLLLITLAIIFTTSFTFANNDAAPMENAANSIRNFVGNIENGVEDTAKNISGASKNATEGMENTASDITGTNDNNGNMKANDNGQNNGDNRTAQNGQNNENTMAGGMTNSSGNYTAQRTAASTDGKLLGMNSTTWIWLIMAILAIAIIALVYYYSTSNRTKNYNDDGE